MAKHHRSIQLKLAITFTILSVCLGLSSFVIVVKVRAQNSNNSTITSGAALAVERLHTEVAVAQSKALDLEREMAEVKSQQLRDTTIITQHGDELASIKGSQEQMGRLGIYISIALGLIGLTSIAVNLLKRQQESITTSNTSGYDETPQQYIRHKQHDYTQDDERISRELSKRD